MSEHASTGAAAPAAASFIEKNHFLLRRMHSLSGVLPVGVFLCVHLFTNFQMLFGTFQHEVDFIHNMPALLFVEVFGLWLPIAFHAALGFVYIFSGKANTRAYPYLDNWRYNLQRWTGFIAIIFIFVHIAKLRWGWSFGGLLDTPFYSKQWDPALGQLIPLAQASTALALQHAFPWIIIFYAIGVLAAVYHWSNGLWTFAISWGLTVSVQAQRRWGHLCVLLGLSLTAFTLGALYAAATYQPTPHELELIAGLKNGSLVYQERAPHTAAPSFVPTAPVAPPVP